MTEVMKAESGGWCGAAESEGTRIYYKKNTE